LSNYKKFKDPVYGYIQVDAGLVKDIIDTPCFQRLHDVIQTSYAPLYSSAVHNRFVHSLGVYHLGCIAADTVQNDSENYNFDISRYLEIFKVACLLHDVGHAPFSHTGEDFYLKDGERTEIHKELISLTEDTNLEWEIVKKQYKAAPHELMSVIVSLKEFSFLFENPQEKSFFARCIVGYPYVTDDKEHKDSSSSLHSFLNCMISLLNSSVIDVDKLDYLIRDAYIIGFDTVSIDYTRLLENFEIKGNAGNYDFYYKKGAVSVIENVVFAHDAEKKWIQNHPVVVYESYLLKRIMEELQTRYNTSQLFSYDSLSEDGINISDTFRVRLLSDSDIMFLMKNLDSEAASEYFDRNNRRHSFWKSEAEYKALIGAILGDKSLSIFEKRIKDLHKYLNNINGTNEINEAALKACNEDIEAIKKDLLSGKGMDSDEQIRLTNHLNEVTARCEWLTAFKDFADKENIKFDFVILEANQFNSGFSKNALGEIKIHFPTLKNACNLGDVANILKADKSHRKFFYYIFYRRDDNTRKVPDVKHLLGNLVAMSTREAVINQ
jgi:hypothetical protein